MELLEFWPDANYEDRHGKISSLMRLSHLKDFPQYVCLEIKLEEEGREDDTIELRCDVYELLEKIGRAMQKFDD